MGVDSCDSWRKAFVCLLARLATCWKLVENALHNFLIVERQEGISEQVFFSFFSVQRKHCIGLPMASCGYFNS